MPIAPLIRADYSYLRPIRENLLRSYHHSSEATIRYAATSPPVHGPDMSLDTLAESAAYRG